MLKNKRTRKNTKKQEDIKTVWNVWGGTKKKNDKIDETEVIEDYVILQKTQHKNRNTKSHKKEMDNSPSFIFNILRCNINLLHHIL